ncbi:MAG: LPP20 family lipoprotein [Thiohalomonadales bacterium]
MVLVKRICIVTIFLSLLVLSGCSFLGGGFHKNIETKSSHAAVVPPAPTLKHTSISPECIKLIENNPQTVDQLGGQSGSSHVKVGATGYGAPPKNYYPAGQRRLMTIRAAKIDAYRALTEVVGGLHVWGSTAIEDMVLEKDRYRTFLDTYIRGARIVSVSEMKDGTYKSVVEMQVDRQFLSQVMTFIDPMLAQCLRNNGGMKVVDNSNSLSSPSFYYSE